MVEEVPVETRDAAELRRMADSVSIWWHSLDLGHGVVTKGMRTPADLRVELESLRLPDLRGKSVVDIGAWDGYFSFAAERLGAARVVALDHYVWSLDLPNSRNYWQQRKAKGMASEEWELTPHWKPSELPGKRGYDIAHRALGSKVETVVGDFMKMDLASLGQFDVALFLGVLYHMKDPFGALRRLAAVTKELAVIETHAMEVPGCEHLELCQFYSSDQLNNDISNWWGPNLKCLEGMCRAAGFSSFELVSKAASGHAGGVHHFRYTARVRK